MSAFLLGGVTHTMEKLVFYVGLYSFFFIFFIFFAYQAYFRWFVDLRAFQMPQTKLQNQ